MGLKSTLFIITIGIIIGYVARDYDKELRTVKSYVLDFISKLTTNVSKDKTTSRKEQTDKSKPPKESKAKDAGTAQKKDTKKKAKKDPKKSDSKERLFTKTELWDYYRGGKGSKGLHIAIMGRVYDVKKGEKHYGTDGGYSFFAGRDGTKAYSTGEFNDEGLTDDLTGVEVSHFGEYKNWVEFFDKDYTYVGKLIGRFYDENGQPTEALDHAHNMMKEAQKVKDAEEEHNKRFPTCNSEWTQAKGSRVWCTKKSGGIDRDWVGVPRMLRHVNDKSSYCVCIRNTGPPTLGHSTENKNRGNLDYPYLKEYEGCDPNSASCKIIRKTD